AKLRDQLAVCVAHSGPGTANIINGIADAYSDRVPVLLITGQVPSWNIGTNYKQFVNQLELTRPLTVFSSIVTNPDAIVDLLVKAMTMSIVKGGVSHLVIPMDMWEANTNALPREYPPHLIQKKIPHQELIKDAVQRIEQASQPVILYGRGVKNCRPELKQIANKIDAGLIHSLPAKGIIEYKNNSLLGGLGLGGNEKTKELLGQANLIITLGTTWWPMDYVPRRPQIIQFDAIKENIGATHPVDLGIVGDLKLSLQSLIKEIPQQNKQAWKKRINKAHQAWLESLEEKIQVTEPPLSPQSIIQSISQQIANNEVIALDSGDNVIWFGKYFANHCQDILISGTWRTMGFGLPAALVAKINRPQDPVTCIIGDGGIGMVLGEILTAVRYQLPVRIIVLNNGTLSMEKNRMLIANLQPEEVDLTNPDFVKLAKTCGAQGLRATSINELNEILEQTKEPQQPVLIDIPTATPIAPGLKLQ
ncbi:MAG: pyruvate oxidase, partial [Candidatus Frackibacter sp. T328-2]